MDEVAEGDLEEPVQRECLGEKKKGILGLKVTGLFVGCGMLMTLGWGGVTSTLVLVFEAGLGRRIA